MIVLDSGDEEWKRKKDMTGGLLRLPAFVIQHAVAMNRGARRPGTSSPPLSPHRPPFPPRVSGAFAAYAAETEQPSSAGHLAECFCLPVSRAGSARALPGEDGV